MIEQSEAHFDVCHYAGTVRLKKHFRDVPKENHAICFITEGIVQRARLAQHEQGPHQRLTHRDVVQLQRDVRFEDVRGRHWFDEAIPKLSC